MFRVGCHVLARGFRTLSFLDSTSIATPREGRDYVAGPNSLIGSVVRAEGKRISLSRCWHSTLPSSSL